MELKDFLITPIYIILFTIVAIVLKPYISNAKTKKYLLPALWIRFVGGICLGLIYQFYYGGGDTFSYWLNGSRWIVEAFKEDVSIGIQLLFERGGERIAETYNYSQHIWYYKDPSSYLIVRLASLFDLLTFHTYSATALFFASFNFSGLWALFTALEKKYFLHTKWLAISILFVPTVVFWGSGILKDSVTLGALGWLIWAMVNVIEFRKKKIVYWIVMVLAAYSIMQIKIYILLALLPAVISWLYWKYFLKIRSAVAMAIFIPFVTFIFLGFGYLMFNQLEELNSEYTINNIAERSNITSYDIRYGWGARTGSDGGYDLGKQDGTWQRMIRLAPAAINVSLFRPYIWEVRNPLMFLSALEALNILILTILFFLKGVWRQAAKDPFLIFCLVFSLLFCFAVGVSTYNFGTLMRYKIPMFPFYCVLITIPTFSSRIRP